MQARFITLDTLAGPRGNQAKFIRATNLKRGQADRNLVSEANLDEFVALENVNVTLVRPVVAGVLEFGGEFEGVFEAFHARIYISSA
jgi:hypothetical protein